MNEINNIDSSPSVLEQQEVEATQAVEAVGVDQAVADVFGVE